MRRLDEAYELLKQISAEFDIDIASLRDPCRLDYLVKARREFCVRGRAMGISATALGRAIHRDHSVVCYHSSFEMRSRKLENLKIWRSERVFRVPTPKPEKPKQESIPRKLQLSCRARKEITAKFADGEVTRVLAEQYDVHIDTIRRIVRRAGLRPRPPHRPRIYPQQVEA